MAVARTSFSIAAHCAEYAVENVYNKGFPTTTGPLTIVTKTTGVDSSSAAVVTNVLWKFSRTNLPYNGSDKS